MNLKAPEACTTAVLNIINLLYAPFYFNCLLFDCPLKNRSSPPPRFFITNPPIEGQPIDFALLADEEYKQFTCYQKESRIADEKGGQVLVCLQSLHTAAVHDSLRHIYDDPTLTKEPWTKIQQALDFLRADLF